MPSSIIASSSQRSPFWQKRRPGLFLLFALLIALAACSAGNTLPQASASPTTSPKPQATPTTLPSGTLLYQADWSHGLKDWHPSAGWKFVHGLLQSDVSPDNVLTAPYMPAVPDYAVEVHFQIVSIPKNGGYVVLSADKVPGKDGYVAGIINLLAPGPRSEFANPSIQVYLVPPDDMDSQMMISDYEPGTLWHTYRVEVRGSSVRFIMDDVGKSSTSSTQTDHLSNGPLRLKVAGAVVLVQSFRIMTL